MFSTSRNEKMVEVMGWSPLPKRHLTCQCGKDIPTDCREANAMKITTIGIDLAKNVLQVHGVDERGKVLLKKQLKRDQMITFFANLPGNSDNKCDTHG